MESSFRVLLLLIGFVIVIGVIWDSVRSSKRRRKLITPSQHVDPSFCALREEQDEEEDTFFDEIEEVIVRKPRTQLSEEVMVVKSKAPVEKQSEPQLATPTLVATPPEVISFYVMARKPGTFYGKRLLEALREVNVVYGDYQIFHRYEHQDGTGNKIFSIALAVEPGVFELSKMDTLATPGVVLFFEVTSPNQSIAAFELMLRTAKLLANRLDGEIKDGERKPLMLNTIEKIRERIRKGRIPNSPTAWSAKSF